MIYYIGYYDLAENNVFSRHVSPAAVKKMDYIIKCLGDTCEHLIVLSPALPKKSITTPTNTFIRGNIHYFFPRLKSPKTRVGNYFNRFFSKKWLKKRLSTIKSCDTVVCYHTAALSKTIFKAKEKYGFSLILEIEEIYSKIWKIKPSEKKYEELLLNKYGDGGIVVSEVLKNSLKHYNSIVSYGDYSIFSGNIDRHSNKRKVKKMLFSGGIEETRGGAFNALRLMLLLKNDYELIITGVCDKKCRVKFLDFIKDINNLKGWECVKYLGLLNKIEFEKVLLDCDISLNLQNSGTYSEYLFPSKIITYLSYNIPVITTPGKSILESQFKNLLYITKDFSLESVVDTLNEIDFNHCDYRDALTQADSDFRKNLRTLIHEKNTY